MSKTVLLVSQRPSDYVEMKRCALALRERGLNIVFLYHCLYEDNEGERTLLDEMRALKTAGVFKDAPIMEEPRPRLPWRSRSRHRPQVATVRERNKFWQFLVRLIVWLHSLWRPLGHPMVWLRSVLQPPASRFWRRWVHPVLLWKQRTIGRPFFWLRRKVTQILLWPIGIFVGWMAPLLRVSYVVQIYIRRFREYQARLAVWKPDIIILPEDVVGLVTPLTIKAGHLQGIPSLIVPYTIANQQEAYRSLSTNPALYADHWYNWVVAKFAKPWVMTQNGLAVLRLPNAHVYGMLAVGAAPPDPWMMNSGFANAIAVENRAMWQYYRDAGIPESKMRVVGAIYDDYLAHFLINKAAELDTLRAELGITNRKPLLLIGGCPDQSPACPAFEFSNFREFADRLAAAVKELENDYEIIVRPHPNQFDLGDMMASHGLRVSDIDTARLVALCDVYIAFGSATIRWAVSCGIPTINYDVFQYDYSDFKGVGGVLPVKMYVEFVDAVRQMRPGSSALQSLAKDAKVEAARWGMLDGKSVDRILALIDELCAAKPATRTAA